MLILKRKADEEIRLGNDIKIKIISVVDGIVKIGIDAPKSIPITRSEIYENIKENLIEASKQNSLILEKPESLKINKLKDHKDAGRDK